MKLRDVARLILTIFLGTAGMLSFGYVAFYLIIYWTIN